MWCICSTGCRGRHGSRACTYLNVGESWWGFMMPKAYVRHRSSYGSCKYRKTELPDKNDSELPDRSPRSECAEGVNLPDMVPTVQSESYFAKMNFHTPNPHTQTFTHVRGWERLVCGVKPCVANHGSKSKNTPFAAGK